MTLFYIAPVTGLHLSENPKTLQIDKFYLSNDRSVFKSLAPDFESLSKSIGTISTNAIYTNTCAFGEFEITGEINGKITHSITSFLSSSINNLWFLKDNSSFINTCFFQERERKTSSMCMYDVFLSNSEGEFLPIVVGDEIISPMTKIIAQIHVLDQLIDNSQKGCNKSEKLVYKTPGDEEEYNSFNRIHRALLFILNARKESLLPYKIAFYVGSLECLFSTSDQEIAHQVAEKCSFYIGGAPELKQINYDLIKDAYGVRSRFVHGDEMTKKFKTNDSLKKLSKEIDILVRIIINKILNDHIHIFSGNKEKILAPYLKKLIFQ